MQREMMMVSRSCQGWSAKTRFPLEFLREKRERGKKRGFYIYEEAFLQ
jgi:hypothetical protein